ncbi:MAG: hypothetical protein QG578_989 [Thermodesulfobacteriota bacterium]|nr:hypothetical protein [Thermodesulfobacteriota bacterium]
MNNIPVISVVLAVYNGQKYLKPSIESVLAQSYGDFEFIIVNDASTDSTLNIINSYDDPRIIIHNNNENAGQTASLNVGLRIARGKYIARTDAGDISMPDRFLKQIRFLDEHSDIDILGTAAFQYDMAGKFCGNVFMPNRPSTILQRIFFACPVIHISVMMRLDRILELGGYNESYRILADYGLWAKALQNGFRFWNLEDILAGYLLTPDSFGYSHGRGRSVQEAASIITEIALNLTGVKLTPDEAENIYRFFVFGPQDLDKNQSDKVEMLFESILIKLDIPQRDIDYLLMRSYAKKLLYKDVLIKSLTRYRGLVSAHLHDDLSRYIKTVTNSKTQAIGLSIPSFK